MNLFISYSRDDKNIVYEFVEKLKDDFPQYDVWLDRRLIGAELWWDTILNKIQSCQCFVIVLTPRSISSIYCPVELEYAVALGKPILPLLLKPCEVPQSLRKIQMLKIDDLALDKTVIRCAQALVQIEQKVLNGVYVPPKALPSRPTAPEPKKDVSDDVFEIFLSAEEASLENNIALAEDLYQRVIQADPQGLGVEAVKRLSQMVKQRDSKNAYMKIKQMVEKELLDGARAAWHVYVQKYGIEYDPNNFAAILSEGGFLQEKPPVPSSMSPSPAAEVDTHEGRGSSDTRTPVSLSAMTINTQETATLHRLEAVLPASDVQVAFEQKAMPQDRVEVQTTLPRPSASPKEATHLAPVIQMAPDEKLMQLVPASKCILGKGEVHELPDFYIDTWPVTNAEYHRFVMETGAKPPAAWHWGMFPRERAEHPVTGVSWHDAVAYAQWAGKRLPTAAEWEKAARGTDGRRYPWGEDFDPGRCNTAESRRKTTTPVKQYLTGASPYGVLDMTGNVWEWTSDEGQTRGMARQGQDRKRILKGGAWNAPKGSAECAAQTSAWSTDRSEDVGFRCVLSVDKKQITKK